MCCAKSLTNSERGETLGISVLSPTLQDKYNSVVMCPQKIVAHQKPQWKQTRHHSTLLFYKQQKIGDVYQGPTEPAYLARIKWKTRRWQAGGEQVPAELVLMGIPHLAVRQVFIRIWMYFPHFAHPARWAEPLLQFTSFLSSKNSPLVTKKSENYRVQHHSPLLVRCKATACSWRYQKGNYFPSPSPMAICLV